MADASDEIPVAVRQLIAERLDSIAQLEVLLLLYHKPGRAWTAEAVSEDLRIDSNWAGEQLATLRDRGLLVETAASEKSYRFGAGTAALEEAVAALSVCYSELRVRVVALLYSNPPRGIRSLADAFVVQRKDRDG
jgi:hypothetical protein